MSDVGSFSSVLTPSTGAASPSNAVGSSKATAAFSGVLERVAAQTASDRPGKPAAKSGVPADDTQARTPSPQQDAAETPDASDDQTSANPSAGVPPQPSAVIDFSALAQAALGVPPPASGGTPPQSPAAPAVSRPDDQAVSSGSATRGASGSFGPALPLQTATRATLSSGTSSPQLSPAALALPRAPAPPSASATPGAPAVSPLPPASSAALPAAQSASTGADASAASAVPVSPKGSALPGSPVPASGKAPAPALPDQAGSSSGPAETVSNPPPQPDGSGSTAEQTDGRAAQQAQRAAIANQAVPTSNATPPAVPDPAPTRAAGSKTTAVLPALKAASATAASGPPAATATPSPQPVLPSTQDGSDGSGPSGQGTSGGKAKPQPGSVQAASAASTTSVTAASDIMAASASPAQQIVTALQSLGLKSVSSAAQSSPAGAASVANPAAPAGTVKTLTIELNPGHLGAVSITMRMQADSVDIQIAVSNPQTLQLLDRDKHLLSAAVEAAGGSRDSLQIAGLSPGAGSSDPGAAGQSYPQGQGGRQDSFSSGASSTGGQAQNQGQPIPSTLSQSDDDDTMQAPPPASPTGRDGSLYL